jgi:hypothetical protein
MGIRGEAYRLEKCILHLNAFNFERENVRGGIARTTPRAALPLISCTVLIKLELRPRELGKSGRKGSRRPKRQSILTWKLKEIRRIVCVTCMFPGEEQADSWRASAIVSEQGRPSGSLFFIAG